jgi:7-cyano-7-deazaguanine synthase
MSTLAIVSGGMDSVTLLHMLHDDGEKHLGVISFNYGQRHNKELFFAEQNCKDLEVPWTLVDMRFMRDLLKGSALTDINVDVPEGHYEAESMKATVVPNRNMIMISIAAGFAVANEYDQVAVGIHSGDHAVYPDCRPLFAEKMNEVLFVATDGFWGAWADHLYTPFIFASKADIVSQGHTLAVDWTKTWSCYMGGDIHCGRCGTCVERKEAFVLAEVTDPTDYEDPGYEIMANR